MVSTMKMVDTKKRVAQVGTADGVRVNKTGRRTFSLEYKLRLVKQCGEPGVSVAGLALEHRINANLLRRWIVRHQRELAEASGPSAATMLPVTIESTPSPPAPSSTERGPSKRRARPSAPAIEIEFYGARIHVRGAVDAELLRRVLDVLARR